MLNAWKELSVVKNVIQIVVQRKLYMNSFGMKLKEKNFPSIMPVIHVSKFEDLSDDLKKKLKYLLLEFYIYIIIVNLNFITNILLLSIGNIKPLSFINYFFWYCIVNILNIFHWGETWLFKYTNRDITFYTYWNKLKLFSIILYGLYYKNGFHGYFFYFFDGKKIESINIIVFIFFEIIFSFTLISLKLLIK